MIALIRKMVETPGPSGYETLVRQAAQAEAAPHADETRVDALGNLIVRKGRRQAGGLKIILAAHLDEIGLMVTHVDEKGFARFTNLGYLYMRNLPGARVRFLNGTPGVIGLEPVENPDHLPQLDRMYIDLGASSREACPVRIGDVAVFERPWLEMGGLITAKALDDRLGVAILIETLRRLDASPHEVYFVFSVQEEVGARGAITAAYGIEPDLGLAVDVTATGDTPKARPMEVSLGRGPAIKVRDQLFISDPRLVAWMARTAEQAGLPHQFEILERGYTDAHSIQVSRAGVPSAAVAIPCRYIHSASETAALSDVENAVRLLVALLSAPVDLG
ncbi:MAG: M20/M25/M40 family metallo-hydrolase [Chloroflexi bacterium]|nr:M20/M25/M40 family metallo-hydrolase [Chloroflexota bacterium]